MGVPGLGPGPRRELEERAVRHGVELRDVTTSRVAVCVLGPAAREVLTRAGAQVLPVGSVRSESIDGIPTLVLHEDEQRWLLLAPAADAAELWSALSDAGAPLGLAYVGADALQHLLVARPR